MERQIADGIRFDQSKPSALHLGEFYFQEPVDHDFMRKVC